VVNKGWWKESEIGVKVESELEAVAEARCGAAGCIVASDLRHWYDKISYSATGTVHFLHILLHLSAKGNR
jgi:hypothetical protein